MRASPAAATLSCLPICNITHTDHWVAAAVARRDHGFVAIGIDLEPAACAAARLVGVRLYARGAGEADGRSRHDAGPRSAPRFTA